MMILKQLASTMVDFDPRFEIMPGTKAKLVEEAHAEAYEAIPERDVRYWPKANIDAISAAQIVWQIFK